MTRRERRGTIVVLVLLALVLAGSLATRSCHDAAYEGVDKAEIQRFERDIDSSAVIVSKPHRDKRLKNKKTRKRRSPSSSPKPAKQPRHIDPVPQF